MGKHIYKHLTFCLTHFNWGSATFYAFPYTIYDMSVVIITYHHVKQVITWLGYIRIWKSLQNYRVNVFYIVTLPLGSLGGRISKGPFKTLVRGPVQASFITKIVWGSLQTSKISRPPFLPWELLANPKACKIIFFTVLFVVIFSRPSLQGSKMLTAPSLQYDP